MFERFTERSRQALAHAQTQARSLGHDFIGTEHLLLGLLRLDGGVAHDVLVEAGTSYEDALAAVIDTSGPHVDAEALASIGIDVEAVERAAEEAFGPGALARAVGKPRAKRFGGPRFTPQAKKVLELALREALTFGHKYVGTEHILLAIVRHRECVAARILRSLVPATNIKHLVIERFGEIAS